MKIYTHLLLRRRSESTNDPFFTANRILTILQNILWAMADSRRRETRSKKSSIKGFTVGRKSFSSTSLAAREGWSLDCIFKTKMGERLKEQMFYRTGEQRFGDRRYESQFNKIIWWSGTPTGGVFVVFLFHDDNECDGAVVGGKGQPPDANMQICEGSSLLLITIPISGEIFLRHS